ncbi:MAG: class II aldolase/adducin family protein [Pseudomonadales bacterium]|nr:class II aldolase/adducin family protein [Pseudomonadales bacterium]MBO7005977.1 class II aldolase/adducin family protein [Pseudomonadales bacterium]
MSEEQARINTAALYRLVALNGWDDLVGTHISARIPGDDHRFLLNPYGMLFEEIRASELLTIDIDGNQLTESDHTYNHAGFTIHSAVHMHRPDAMYVIHLHTDHGVAVSCQKEGLRPINQTAIAVYSDLAYHDYEGVATNLAERERLVRDLGDKNAMILRNHGTMACGPNPGGVWQAMYRLEKACQYQILAQSGGSAINDLSQDIIDARAGDTSTVKLAERGEFIWPALLRKLDRIDPSYRD